MATIITSIRDLPKEPGIYAMIGGRGRSGDIAYVGKTGNLRRRLDQHLIKRNSSVATGTSAVVLNVDQIKEVRWWLNPEFYDDNICEAAELIAFDVLQPVLRSRGKSSEKSKKHFKDPDFQERFTRFFEGEPTGRLVLPSMADLMERVSELEKYVREK